MPPPPQRLLNRITLLYKEDQQHHESESTYITFGPGPRHDGQTCVLSTSGEYIRRRSGWVHRWRWRRRSPDGSFSKKEFELLRRHPQSIHSSCGHCYTGTLVRALRRKEAKSTRITFFVPIVSRNSASAPTHSGNFGSHSSHWQNI